MIIIFGRRSYGRVDAHGGEHAQTTFAHVYYMPIVPVSSFWVTQDLGGAARGFSIRTSGKSIVAAYLRCWAPIAALAVLATGSIAGYVVAAGLAAASAWAWSWRALRGGLEHRRSDFQMLAFGTRCDPERMPSELRENLKHNLDERWAALDVKRSPDEVAEVGATSTREAVIAYGLLRLAAIDAPRDARVKAATAARRILDGARDTAPTGDGPYRAADPEPASPPIFTDVANAANLASAAKQEAGRKLPRTRTSRISAKRLGVIMLAMLGFGSIYGIAVNAAAFGGAQQLSANELRDSHSGFVAVRCDAMQSVGIFGASKTVYACVVGGTHGASAFDVILPIVGFKGFATKGTLVEGKLHSMHDGEYLWPDGVRDAPDLTGTYLEFSPVRDARAIAIELIVILGLLLAGFGVWFAIKRRRSQRE